MPTPCGVPVMIRVPGRSVVLALKKLMRVATSKIMSSVDQSWRTSPFTVLRSLSCWGSGISSAVVRHGPKGRNVSNILPRPHWLPPRLICQSRALTSLAQV